MPRQNSNTPPTPLIASIAIFVLSILLLALAACRAPEGDEQAAAPVAATPSAPPAAATPAPSPVPPATAGGPAPVRGQTPGQAPVRSTLAPGVPSDRPLRAAFLVVDGVYNTELMAPFDVFHHTAFHAKPGIEVFTVSPDGRPIQTFEGLQITPSYSFANTPPVDILVIPSTRGSMDRDLQDAPLIDWVRRTGSQARHVLSLCDSTFVLARAGLLDGVPATTFPEDYGRFSQMFPGVDLRVNVTFVDAGKVITSQGGARSYEAAMHLVDKLYGRQVAEAIGRGLLVPWPPDPDTMTARIVEPSDGTSAPAAPAPTPASPGPAAQR
jgi:putative intracellular protease/amidase